MLGLLKMLQNSSPQHLDRQDTTFNSTNIPSRRQVGFMPSTLEKLCGRAARTKSMWKCRPRAHPPRLLRLHFKTPSPSVDPCVPKIILTCPSTENRWPRSLASPSCLSHLLGGHGRWPGWSRNEPCHSPVVVRAATMEARQNILAWQ